MKKIIYKVLLLIAAIKGTGCANSKEKPTNTNNMNTSTESIYTIKVNTIDGKTIDLSTFKGKKILIVNTASECGYTPQYTELQELHEKYNDKVVVIGFPANDFGGQEPGTNTEIQSFCSKNYGVSFLMMEKIIVSGNAKHPLYQWLSDKNKNGWNDQAPTWNFCKYLIDENGELLGFYPSGANPLGEEMLSKIGV